MWRSIKTVVCHYFYCTNDLQEPTSTSELLLYLDLLYFMLFCALSNLVLLVKTVISKVMCESGLKEVGVFIKAQVLIRQNTVLVDNIMQHTTDLTSVFVPLCPWHCEWQWVNADCFPIGECTLQFEKNLHAIDIMFIKSTSIGNGDTLGKRNHKSGKTCLPISENADHSMDSSTSLSNQCNKIH